MSNPNKFFDLYLYGTSKGKPFEQLIGMYLPPALQEELGETVTWHRGNAMDRAGVDIEVSNYDGGLMDVCLDARDKVIKIAESLAHKLSNRNTTECVLTRALLDRYRSREIDADEMIARGGLLWTNLLEFACENRPALLMCVNRPDLRARIVFPFPTD